jgi:pyruvate dehydrogenase E2 component (dihydrolipoamide acetyltransferase)
MSNKQRTAAPERRGTLIELSPMRAAIARRMTESKQQVPHFYVETDVVMDEALDSIAQTEATTAGRMTVTAFLARACAVALRSHPELNAVWTSRGLEQIEHVNLGIAIALEDGLIAPALLGLDSMNLAETSDALAELVARAKHGKLRTVELSDGTFTLSNLGMFDVTRFAAIVVPPQVAILATGRIVRRATVVEDEIACRSVMTVTASADHRAVDGATVASFLGTFKALVEQPANLQ